MLLLKRSPDTTFSAGDVAKRLYIPPDNLAPELERLCKLGIARHNSDGKFQYAPKTERQRDVLNRLDDLYSEKRVKVVDLIFSQPVQSFADAFLIVSEDDEWNS